MLAFFIMSDPEIDPPFVDFAPTAVAVLHKNKGPQNQKMEKEGPSKNENRNKTRRHLIRRRRR